MPVPRGAGGGYFEKRRRSMIAGCTSVSAVLDLPLARRPSTSVHAVAMEDGDSSAPLCLRAGRPPAT